MTATTARPGLEESIPLLHACPNEQLRDKATQLATDPVVAEVISSRAFQRLRGISFLGALDYIAPTYKLAKAVRSRADHSLHVAALAGFVAQERGYDHELERHLIIAGLLHDIGHPPLSHSIEPYLEKTFGYGHHEMGEMLLTGQNRSGKQLKKTLMQAIDTGFIRDLIAGKAKNTDGGDLFSSPINIDTIEGIIRSYRYLQPSSSTLDPLNVAAASFLTSGKQRYKVLDAFWHLKGFVYDKLITQDVGLIADQFSQAYLEQSQNPLEEKDLFATEKQWRNKHKLLFNRLASIKSENDAPAELDNRVVEYKTRRYFIKDDQFGMQRYCSAKYGARKKFEAVTLGIDKQLRFVL
jgi:uncharacterized protein